MGIPDVPSPTEVASVGRGIFEWLLFFMLLLVLFLVPGQTAGAIAGERERQTLVPLQMTLLRPRSIVLGKIGASLVFLTLLVVVAVPLLAVTYLIGGVSFGDVLRGALLVLLVGLVVGCLSAAISAFARRVQTATVLSYGLVLGLVVGSLAVQAAVGAIDSSRGTDESNPPGWLLLANPVATLTGAVDDGEGRRREGMDSPFDAMEDRLHAGETSRRSDEEGCITTIMPDGSEMVECTGAGGGFVEARPVGVGGDGGDPGDKGSSTEGFWWQSSLLLTALAALAVVFAARRLRTPAETER